MAGSTEEKAGIAEQIWKTMNACMTVSRTIRSATPSFSAGVWITFDLTERLLQGHSFTLANHHNRLIIIPFFFFCALETSKNQCIRQVVVFQTKCLSINHLFEIVKTTLHSWSCSHDESVQTLPVLLLHKTATRIVSQCTRTVGVRVSYAWRTSSLISVCCWNGVGARFFVANV